MKDHKILVSGSAKKLKQIFFDYHYALCSFINNILNDENAAKDLVQELFIRFSSMDREFADEHSLKCFLYVSAKNLAIDEIRRRERSPQYVSLEKMRPEQFSDEEYVLERLVEDEYKRLLLVALDRLGPTSRKVVTMWIQGCSNAEISESLNIAVSTVKTLKTRALEKMRKISGSAVILLTIIFVI